MSDEKTLKELEHLGESISMKELKSLINTDVGLSNQLSITAPQKSLIRKQDLSLMIDGKICALWGKDPNNGWVCIKWA